MAHRYKVYVHDTEIGIDYPITIAKDNISDFCKWLNAHISKWNLKVTDAYLLDDRDVQIQRLHFLKSEYKQQFFISSYAERLLKYAESRGG